MSFILASARHRARPAATAQTTLAGFALSGMFLLSPALAQQESLTLPEALQFCANIKDEGERLECFEALADTAGGQKKTAAASNQAEAPQDDGGETTVAAVEDADDQGAPDIDAGEKKKKRRIPFFGRGGDDPATVEVEQDDKADDENRFIIRRADAPEEKRKKRERYEDTVYKAWRNGAGKLRVAFRSGEIWRELDQTLDYDPQPGEQVEFRPGSFGSWMVYFKDGKRGLSMTKMN